MSNLARLNLDDVRDRLYEKYDVTRFDSQLAVEYLRCFFDAKRRRPNDLIILPQIADWAWHELILDTARYQAICMHVFGQFLHHIVKPIQSKDRNCDVASKAADRGSLNPRYGDSVNPAKSNSTKLREAFEKSLDLMHKIYGLGFGDHPDEWRDSGWDRPLYRLRNPVQVPYGYTSNRAVASRDAKRPPFLSWLPGRIVRRFGIPVAAARRAVREYSEFFFSFQSADGIVTLSKGAVLTEIAWEEHVLWTRRYAQDCDRVLGYFLEHLPRANPAASDPSARSTAQEIVGSVPS